MSTPTQVPRNPQPAPRRLTAGSEWRHDAGFQWPDRVPWSVLGPQWHAHFGRADPADPQPENIAFYGQNGSGKTHAAGKILQERAYVTRDADGRPRPSILIAHKPVDKTLLKIGFPIANTWDQVVRLARDGYVNIIYWPRTRLMGAPRKAWYDTRISDLLDRLWAAATPEEPADIDVWFDDAGFAEELPLTGERMAQYLREGRAPGFSTGILKQRVQRGSRLQASETQWTLGFRPKDDADLERWAELFGSKRDWMPVLRTVRRDKREFLLKHSVTDQAWISWMDEPLEPVQGGPPRHHRGLRELITGRG